MSDLLEVRDVSRHFGGVQALDGVNISVAEGEVVGLVGPNGSGKSTLINVISGSDLPTRGEIKVDGKDVTGWPPHRIVGEGVARTYQRPRPFAGLSLEENVMMSSAFRSDLGGMEEARLEAVRCLELVGLGAMGGMAVTKLNLHQLKFLELARALAARPRLLLLDEVLSGLNPTEVDESVAMLRRLAGDGTTLVVVEHIIRVVMELCSRVIVLDEGRLIAQGAPGEVMADPEVRRAYLGTKAT
ncbi:MAG: ATP-binding cassette domain-containing protein [Acidimicrobiia bacterium]